MKIITGRWQTATGAPAAGADLVLQLSDDAVALGITQVSPIAQHITLDSTGSIPANRMIWACDELTTDSDTPLFYAVSVTLPGLGTIYQQNLVIAGSSPIDLNTL